MERFFYDKGDLCSEVEVIRECETLNGRVETLVYALQDEWQTRDGASDPESSQEEFTRTIGDIDEELCDAVGKQLFDTLRELSPNDDDYHGHLQDALQAWTVCTLRKAMLSTLFGVDERTDNDLNLIFSQMQTRGE